VLNHSTFKLSCLPIALVACRHWSVYSKPVLLLWPRSKRLLNCLQADLPGQVVRLNDWLVRTPGSLLRLLLCQPAALDVHDAHLCFLPLLPCMPASTLRSRWEAVEHGKALR